MYDWTLLPFFTSMMLLLLIVLAVGVHFWRNTWIMVLIIPLAMFCGFSGYKTITDVLGYPVAQEIPEDSLYLSHIADPDGVHLYVWVVEPDKLLPKNIRIVASENNKKTLQDAGAKNEKGVKQSLGRKESLPGSEYNPGEYRNYNFNVDPNQLKNQR